MLFIHTWEKVLSGEKTQTRRLVKPEHEVNHWRLNGDDDDAINEVMVRREKPTSSGDVWRNVWCEGNTYAVQPGRGKKAVGRIRITGIRREYVQDIHDADAIAEGCTGDKIHMVTPRDEYADLWDTIHTKPGTRWADNPSVWVLTFEVVR